MNTRHVHGQCEQTHSNGAFSEYRLPPSLGLRCSSCLDDFLDPPQGWLLCVELDGGFWYQSPSVSQVLVPLSFAVGDVEVSSSLTPLCCLLRNCISWLADSCLWLISPHMASCHPLLLNPKSLSRNVNSDG